MAPVVDGPDGFLPDSPHRLRKSGRFNPVPMLIGITRNEGTLFATNCESSVQLPITSSSDIQADVTFNKFEDNKKQKILANFVLWFLSLHSVSLFSAS